MPPKKKGKGTKIKKDEATIKAERMAERVEKKKEEVRKELKIQDIMRKTLNRKWHNLVLNTKLPVMKEDLRAMKAIFDRVISKKQCIIEEIQRQKEIADDQTRLSLAAATELNDHNIRRFGELLEKMNLSYERERDSILKSGAERKERDGKMWEGEENRMDIIKWADNYYFTEKFEQMCGEGVVRHYETKNMFKSILEDTEDAYENLFSGIMEQYRNEIKDYVERTTKNRENAAKLKEKDDYMCKVLLSQDKKLNGSQGVIDELKNEATAYEDGTAMAVIREKFQKYKGDYTMAKQVHENNMQLDMNQFSHLVDRSNDVIWWLEGMVKKCEKIITAMNMCELLQTQQESFSSLHSLYRCRCGLNDLEDVEAIDLNDNLQYLFALMAEADITTKALKQEKNNLCEENESLCEHIKDLMESLK